MRLQGIPPPWVGFSARLPRGRWYPRNSHAWVTRLRLLRNDCSTGWRPTAPQRRARRDGANLEPGREAADDRSVRGVRHDVHDCCAPPVVREQEAGRLEDWRLLGIAPRRAHVRMHSRQDRVDERTAGEQGMHDPEHGTEPPAGLALGPEDRVVDQREQQAVEEMDDVADRAGAAAALAEHRPE